MSAADDFKIIYKILVLLEHAMDCPNFSISESGIDASSISRERLCRYYEMLQDAGLIKNADLHVDMMGEMFVRNEAKIRITLKGLAYLRENSVIDIDQIRAKQISVTPKEIEKMKERYRLRD